MDVAPLIASLVLLAGLAACHDEPDPTGPRYTDGAGRECQAYEDEIAFTGHARCDEAPHPSFSCDDGSHACWVVTVPSETEGGDVLNCSGCCEQHGAVFEA